jgi:hypothetical protein
MTVAVIVFSGAARQDRAWNHDVQAREQGDDCWAVCSPLVEAQMWLGEPTMSNTYLLL